MRNPDDFWPEDEFEDTVAAALIACFETRVKKLRGTTPSDRLTDDRLAMVRATGPYIPSNSRVIVGPDSEQDNWSFDVVNDALPQVGCVAMRPSGMLGKSLPNVYMQMFHIRRVDSLGKNWLKRQAGALYEMLDVSAEPESVCGERRYFTVTPTGDVVSCNIHVQDGSKGYTAGARHLSHQHDDVYLRETEAWASVALQFLADRAHCWTITAQESKARAHLGCMMEEIKSLLYARSLPMTATGRKRPILHLVESHKRRMQNGTDIDVSSFIRGQQTVEIGGTLFKVNPPSNLIQSLSKASQIRCAA